MIIFAELCIGVKCVFDDRDSGCAGSLWSIVQVKPEFPCLYFEFFSFLFDFVPYMTFISDLNWGFMGFQGVHGPWITVHKLWTINHGFGNLQTSKAASRRARLIFVHMASRGSGRNFWRACCPILPFLPQSGWSSTSHLSSFRCNLNSVLEICW